MALVLRALSDDFLSSVTPAISNNYRLKALNLSKNDFTDAAVNNFFIALRHGNSLQDVSFQGCGLKGSFLSTSCGLLISGKLEATAEDGKVAKELAKVVGDKNKAIKALNGKRKKAGFTTEISDIVAPPSFVTGNTILNRSVASINLSYNPIILSDVETFISKVAEAQDIEAEGLPQLTIIGKRTLDIEAEKQEKVIKLLKWVSS